MKFARLIQARAQGLSPLTHYSVRSTLLSLGFQFDARIQLLSYLVSSRRSGSQDQESPHVESCHSFIPPARLPRETVLAGIGLLDLNSRFVPDLVEIALSDFALP